MPLPVDTAGPTLTPRPARIDEVLGACASTLPIVFVVKPIERDIAPWEPQEP